MAKKQQPAVSWYLEGKKRPFAYSTKAESDSISVAFECYGDMFSVWEAYMAGELFLNNNEAKIVRAFIEAGEFKPKIK